MKFITKILNPKGNTRIVFFNPLGMTSDYWLNDIKIEDHFKCAELVLTDYPGYKKTTYIDIPNLEGMSKLFNKELSKLTQKETVFIGCSYGGNVAIKLNQRYHLVKKMVLIGTVPYCDESDLFFYKILKNTLRLGKLFEFSKYLVDFSYTENERNQNPFLALMFFSYIKKNNMTAILLQQLNHLEKNDNYKVDSMVPLILTGEKDPAIKSNYKNKCLNVFEKCVFFEFKNHGHFALNKNIKAIKLITDYINLNGNQLQ